MKCKACNKNKCEQKYENRCFVGKCSCLCQKPVVTDVTEKTLSVATGLIVFAGGVTAVVLSGGALLPLVAGGAVAGAGTVLVKHPIEKQMRGEVLRQEELIKKVLTATFVGAASAPIGFGGHIIGLKFDGFVAPLIIKILTGGIVGGVAEGLSEAVSCVIDGKKIDWNAVKTATKKEAIDGMIFGGIAHGISALTGGMDRNFLRLAAEIILNTTSDVTYQMIQNQSVDLSKIDIYKALIKAGANVGMEFVADGIAAEIKKTSAYAKAMNDSLVNEKVSDPQQAQDIKECLERTNCTNIGANLEEGTKVELCYDNRSIYCQLVDGNLYYMDQALYPDNNVNIDDVPRRIGDPFVPTV